MWLGLLLGDLLIKMFSLQNDHPIYLFLDRQRKLTHLLPLSSQTKASLPLVSTLAGQQPDVDQMHSSKLKVEDLDSDRCSQSIDIISVVQQMPTLKISPIHAQLQCWPSVITISPLHPHQAHPQKIMLMKEVKIDIKPPATPTKHKAPLVIDLCLPEMKPAITCSSVVEAPGVVQMGSIYPSLEAAQENCLGHVWWRGQGTKSGNSSQQKMTFCCNNYHHLTPTHSGLIDHSDHHKGKSIKTNCMAHVNINWIQHSTLWHITFANWDHNHEWEIPLGSMICHPPMLGQWKVVVELATSSGNFSQKQISSVLDSRFSETPKPWKIGNIVTKAWQEAREVVVSLGGDIAAIIVSLQKKIDKGHGWKYHLKLNDLQTVTVVWWQSPLQAELMK